MVEVKINYRYLIFYICQKKTLDLWSYKDTNPSIDTLATVNVLYSKTNDTNI